MKIIFGTFKTGFPVKGRPVFLCQNAWLNFHHSLLLIVILSCLFVFAPSAQADPEYQGNLLYGLDPVITATDNPRLLGIERLVMRQRLLNVGVDPLKDEGKSPNTKDLFGQAWREKSNIDLEHKERLVEYNHVLGIMLVIEYPRFFYLFPAFRICRF